MHDGGLRWGRWAAARLALPSLLPVIGEEQDENYEQNRDAKG